MGWQINNELERIWNKVLYTESTSYLHFSKTAHNIKLSIQNVYICGFYQVCLKDISFQYSLINMTKKYNFRIQFYLKSQYANDFIKCKIFLHKLEFNAKWQSKLLNQNQTKIQFVSLSMVSSTTLYIIHFDKDLLGVLRKSRSTC